jgi:hypothetical protein
VQPFLPVLHLAAAAAPSGTTDGGRRRASATVPVSCSVRCLPGQPQSNLSPCHARKPTAKRPAAAIASQTREPHVANSHSPRANSAGVLAVPLHYWPPWESSLTVCQQKSRHKEDSAHKDAAHRDFQAAEGVTVVL